MLRSQTQSRTVKHRALQVVGFTIALVVVSVYLAEIAAALRLPIAVDSGLPYWSIGAASAANKEDIRKLADKAGVPVDMRHPDDVLAEMRKARDVVAATQTAAVIGAHMAGEAGALDIDRILPLGGISNSHTLLCNQSGQYVSYDSDERGFRNPRGIWDSPRLDMAVVGQSFVQGYCVPDGQTFVDLLRNDYPLTMNLGNSGEAPLLQLGAIREYLSGFSPRAVLWVYQETLDLGDLREHMKLRLPMNYLRSGFSQRLMTRQREIDASLRTLMTAVEAATDVASSTAPSSSRLEETLGLVKLWHLRGWLNAAYGVEEAKHVAWLEEANYEPLTEILRQARDTTHGWGGRLYFVYLPSWSRYRHHAQAVEIERTAVSGVAEGLGIPVIDVRSAFDSHPDPLSLFPFRRFGHYNEEGNRLVAETIRDILRQ